MPRELIKSSLIDHWREDGKQRWTQELICVCSYKLPFRLRIISKESSIGYEVLPPTSTPIVT